MNNNDQNLWAHYQMNNASVFSTTHDRHKKVHVEIKKYIKPSTRVLEIGFGDGYLLGKLSMTYDCYGADISENVVKSMKKNLRHINFDTIGVDGKLPYKDAFFDGFVASEVLEHMDDNELNNCIKEIQRILKAGGYAIITFPAEENLKENECFCPNCTNIFHKWGHKQSWNAERIKYIFEGFEIVKINDYFVKHKGTSIIEWFAGYVFYVIRNLINKFNKLPGRSYLVVIRKR